MIVTFEPNSPVVGHVWFDPSDSLLHVEISGIDRSIPLNQIPDEDFESSTPIIGFGTGCQGTVVVCRHQDGQETWFPVDMWLPKGFSQV